MKCVCDNCDWTGDETEIGKSLAECEDLGERLDEGSVVPVGECPECEAFVYYETSLKKDYSVAFVTAFLAAFRELGTDEDLNGGDAVDRLADLYDIAKSIFPEEAARLVAELADAQDQD